MTTINSSSGLYNYAETEYLEYIDGSYNRSSFLELENWLIQNDVSYQIFLKNHASPFTMEYYLDKFPPYSINTSNNISISTFSVPDTTNQNNDSQYSQYSQYSQDSSLNFYLGFELSPENNNQNSNIEITFDYSLFDATFICVGGGGGGGGCGSNAGTGGGGGGIAFLTTDVSSNCIYSINVGAGGSYGGLNNNGNSGGDSSIYENNENGYCLCHCTGGGGGLYTTNTQDTLITGNGGYCNIYLNEQTNNTFGFGGMGGLGMGEFGTTPQIIETNTNELYGSYSIFYNSVAGDSCTNGMLSLPIPKELNYFIDSSFSGGGNGGTTTYIPSNNYKGSGGYGGVSSYNSSNGENGVVYCYFTYPQTRSQYNELIQNYNNWVAPINFAWNNFMVILYFYKRFFYIVNTENYEFIDDVYEKYGAQVESMIQQFEYEIIQKINPLINSLFEKDDVLKDRIVDIKTYQETFFRIAYEDYKESFQKEYQESIAAYFYETNNSIDETNVFLKYITQKIKNKK
uniref:Glycine-rich domain-containing protein n=1 Tax=viral metagenome TaxID=1070528 RepID=A0A6C0DLD9_9ZZZZ